MSRPTDAEIVSALNDAAAEIERDLDCSCSECKKVNARAGALREMSTAIDMNPIDPSDHRPSDPPGPGWVTRTRAT